MGGLEAEEREEITPVHEAIIAPDFSPQLHNSSRSSVELSLATRSRPQNFALTIRNHSALAQPFLLFPATPSFLPFSIPEELHTSIYQASLLVAPETGSITFVIPPASTRSLEEVENATGPIPDGEVYAITGLARARMEPGLRLFVTDSVLLKAVDQG